MPLDIFDEIDLSLEDKLNLSDEFKKFVLEEVGRQIKKIPITKIISKTIAVQLEKIETKEDIFDELANEEMQGLRENLKKMLGTISDFKKDIEAQLDKTLDKTKEEVGKLKEAEEKLLDKFKKRYDDLRNDILSQPRYEFGGFSPQVNDLNIGDPATEGSWRIVKSGSDLVVETYISSVWTEAARFVRP